MHMSEKELQAYCKKHNLKYTPPHKKKTIKKDDFDSKGEAGFYTYYLKPKIETGEIKQVETHKSFVVLEKDEEYNLKEKRFTPDFIVEWATGETQVFEVKGKQVKKMQRDYQIRKHIFIIKYCKPNRWKYTEIESEKWS